MAVFELRPPLTAEERAEKRRLILRDSMALLSLFAITVILGALTYSLFGSFTRHRDVLARRWRANGERALKSGHPKEAIEALRSALEYAPGQRDLEVELAMALAAANRNLEAAAYFNSLLDTQPGNGLIHLQLARLAAKQGNATLAVEHYQRALDGTWEGDGYQRRLSVRLELAGYLISRKNFPQAQSELRTAAGNAPNVPETRLQIARLMEQAQDPADALDIYRVETRRKNASVEALEGAGRTAYELGRIGIARPALARAVNAREFHMQANDVRQPILQMLENSVRILQLYPDPNLPVRALAGRILNDANIARARFSSCFANANASGEMENLRSQWQQIPAKLSVNALEQDPQLEQTTMSLVYDTETQTAQLCGAPTGDDALLLKIAQAPTMVLQP
ncbi:MAG TPA: tetratricopeptide repeat protein [Silvibacterium sp.]|nr:tetratricopeptide repeat protein [Silvibacterium sp.]